MELKKIEITDRMDSGRNHQDHRAHALPYTAYHQGNLQPTQLPEHFLLRQIFQSSKGHVT